MSEARTVAPASPDNLRVIRRLMEEVWATGDMSLLRELVAHSYIGHLPIGDHYGPDGVRINIESYRRAMPDLTVTLDDLFAVEDKVVRRFTLIGTRDQPFPGTLASGNSVALRGIAIDRLVAGQLVESWVQLDDLPLRGWVLR